MFEKAVRLKLRFSTAKGVLDTEDLWDLSLRALDAIYKDVNADLKALSEDSLLEEQTDREGDLAQLKVDIVKHVFKTKQAEQEEREKALERAEKKRRIMEIIADKQDESLRDMPLEELTKMVDEL